MWTQIQDTRRQIESQFFLNQKQKVVINLEGSQSRQTMQEGKRYEGGGGDQKRYRLV